MYVTKMNSEAMTDQQIKKRVEMVQNGSKQGTQHDQENGLAMKLQGK